MYSNWYANGAVIAATAIAVAVAVLVHYEGLVHLNRWLGRARGPRQARVLYAIGSLLVLHVAEIWLFALALGLLLMFPECGHIQGNVASPLDVVYLSAITFTTVGYGDLAPVGAIRLLCGTEALTGFMLITWSASFTYLEMQRDWRAG